MKDYVIHCQGLKMPFAWSHQRIRFIIITIITLIYIDKNK